MIPVLVASALLLAVMTACVLLSMYVEQRAIARRRARTAVLSTTRADKPSSPPELVEAPGFDGSGVDRSHFDGPGVDGPGEHVTPPPPEVLVVLPGRDAADRAAAVLFAAYVASGGRAARRAAAWVTAVAPSSLDGESFEPGTDLRGRTVAVRRLLEHDQDGRCWLTLRDGVDIRRGVERHPVTCPTLEGAVLFWYATRSAMSAIPDDALERIVATIDELEPVWGPTTGATAVGPAAAELRAAAAIGATVRVQVPLTAPGTVAPTTSVAADGGSSAASTPSVHETV